VHHAIAEGRRRDETPLGITHFDRNIAARTIAAVAKLALQLQKFAFEIGIEGAGAGLPPLAQDGAFGGGVQGGEVDHALEQMIVTLGH
jgi:hypothetical protein